MYHTNSYAPGGRLKRGKMIEAHFNPRELVALDHWQGKKETCPRTGMRSYAHLEELLKNPHILHSLFHKVHEEMEHKAAGGEMDEHFARGGHLHDYHDARLNKLADEGINGDTEIALIGPHTKQVFDHLVRMTHKPLTVNPETGKPHYGFLSGIIGGLGKVLAPAVNLVKKIPLVGNLLGGAASSLGNAAKAAAPAVVGAASNLAAQYLPQLAQKYGGNTVGNLASQGAQFLNNQVQQRLTPQQQQQGGQMAQSLGSMGQSAYNAYNQGGLRGMAGNVVSNVGQQLGGTVGGYADRLGQGIQQNRGFGEMARDLGGQGIRDVGRMYGGELGDYADQFGRGIQAGQHPLGMARDIGYEALNRRLPERYY